jgi:chromosome segregation ATPase
MAKHEKIISVLCFIIIVLGGILGIVCFRTAKRFFNLNTKIEEITSENNSLKNAVERTGIAITEAEKTIGRLRDEKSNIRRIVSELGETTINFETGIEEATKTLEEADSILDDIFGIIGD